MKVNVVHRKHPNQRQLTNAVSGLAGKIGMNKRSRLKQFSQFSSVQHASAAVEPKSLSHSSKSEKSLEPSSVKHEPSPTAKRKSEDAKSASKIKRKNCGTDRNSKPPNPKSAKRVEPKDQIASEARLLEELRRGVTSILSGLDPEENFERPFHGECEHLGQAPSDSASKEGEDQRRTRRRRKNEKNAVAGSGDSDANTKAREFDSSVTKVEPYRFSAEPATNHRSKATKKQVRTKLPTRPEKQGKPGRSNILMNGDTQVIKTGCLEEQTAAPTKRKKRNRHRRRAANTVQAGLDTREVVGSKPLAREEWVVKRSESQHSGEHAADGHQDEFSNCKAVAGADNILSGDEADESDVLPPLKTKKAKSMWSCSSAPASSQDVRERALERLRAAQFRLLNEELYTTQSSDAIRSFEEDPSAFQVYHKGFERQVSRWPVNPVDVIINSLRNMHKSTVIADLGCGEAKIAHTLSTMQVHSFDLKALNERVTVCDMSRLPLYRQTVDVAVFCLSLMGTNLNTFILEANRILKKGGLLKIAEVKSRFKSIDGFPKAMKKFGFQLVQKDDSNKMFVLFDFKKLRSTSKHPYLPQLRLMPCLYKKR